RPTGVGSAPSVWPAATTNAASAAANVKTLADMAGTPKLKPVKPLPGSIVTVLAEIFGLTRSFHWFPADKVRAQRLHSIRDIGAPDDNARTPSGAAVVYGGGNVV